MYSVYKITNLINNKTYIGSSIRVEKDGVSILMPLIIKIHFLIIIHYRLILDNMV